MRIRPYIPAALLCLAAVSSLRAHASSFPIQVDGLFDDWISSGVAAVDPSGDGGSTGIDFTFLKLAHDENRLFIEFDTTAEVQGDEGQDIVLAFDTDRNTATGQSIGGVGAELVWNLGQRSGTFHSGGAHSIGHADIGLLLAPTVSDTRFEIALDRNAVPGGFGLLFPGNDFHLAVIDNDAGDVMALTGPGYSFDAVPQPVPSLSLGRDHASDVRIASWNVENDGLFAGGSREAAQGRIFSAVDPDVWIFCEVWNHSAAQVAAQVETLLPSAPGESWSAVKRDAGNVVASRFPILDSWEIYPGNRLTAVLVDPRPALNSDLLIVANHWNCCTADTRRQEQADALIAFLADARTPGGVIDLAPDTPIVACGDFNLVGWRAQLTTLLTGDIADNATWGPDSPPDWDGSDFANVNARHPDSRVDYTWRSDASTFYPGKLDWMVYTASVLDVHGNHVLDTRSMTAAHLSADGLLATDTETASDHGPIVADFAAAGVSGVELSGPGLMPRLLPNSPNPFRAETRIAFVLPRSGAVDVTVHDVMGRLVRTLVRGRTMPAGPGAVTWDGRDDAGRDASSGLYFYRVTTAGAVRSRSMLLRR